MAKSSMGLESCKASIARKMGKDEIDPIDPKEICCYSKELEFYLVDHHFPVKRPEKSLKLQCKKNANNNIFFDSLVKI